MTRISDTPVAVGGVGTVGDAGQVLVFDRIAVVEPGRDQAVDVGTLTARPDRLEFRGKRVTMTFREIRGIEFSFERRSPDALQRTAAVTLTYGSGGDLHVVHLWKSVAGLPGRVREANRRLAEELRAIYGGAPALDEVEHHALESLEEGVRAARRQQANRYLVIGAVALTIGGLLTVITYANASPGGTYIVAWGPMIYGLGMLIAGTVLLVRAPRASSPAPERAPDAPRLSMPPAPPPTPPADRTVQPDPPGLSVPPAPPRRPVPPAPPVDAMVPSTPPPPAPPADRMGPPPAPGLPPADRTVLPPAPPPGLPPAPSTAGAKRRWAWMAAAGVAALALIVALVVVGGAHGNDTLVTEAPATTEDTSGADPTERPDTEADSTAPSAGAAVSTGQGMLPIVGIELTDVYPPDCVATASVGCLSSTGDRIVVLDLEPADGGDPMETMDAVTQEAFDSTIDDGSGVLAEGMVVAGTTGEPTFEVAYAYLTVDNPTSLTLQWPGNPPITLTP